MGLPLRIVKPHPVHKDEWGLPPLFNSFFKNLSISVFLLKYEFMTSVTVWECMRHIRPQIIKLTPN
jgi:hypothetical protein